MKKIVAVILSIMLCINLFGVEITNAQNSVVPIDVHNAIVNELSLLESVKGSLGIANINFNNLYIGEAIPVYEYTDTGFEEISSVYLIFENEDIVSLFYEVAELQYQMTTSLGLDIRNANVNKCALLYDATGCHLYDGEEIITLGYSGMTIAGREDIATVSQIELQTLELGNIGTIQRLNYVSHISNPQNTRAVNNYTCNVSYVTQQPYDNLCWAATIATISNYVYGTSLTAYTVAQNIYHPSNIDQKLDATMAQSLMRDTYNLYYTYSETAPSVAVILENITNDYPIYGIFESNTDSHAATVYGMNATGSRIMVMDPMCGSVTANSGTYGYSYTPSYAGRTITLERAICRYW